MCDTLGKITRKNASAIFAKNSDREYNEPQVMVYIEAKDHALKKMKTTYIEIEQVKHTHAILISKPTWMWGAEMGVNDCGVCIGNEAIKTETAKNNPIALLGMDFVRLGLERASTAKEALNVIIDLLLKYGQGGNCGYQKETFYDNSFLIMDRQELYILETVGKNYAVKKKQRASISNCLSINRADNYNDVRNFKKKYATVPAESGVCRRRTTHRKLFLAKNQKDFMKILRTHHKTNQNYGVCMHGEYESTNSMIVVLESTPVVYFTGCPNPCKSEYKKYVFGESLVYPIVDEDHQDNDEFWQQNRLNTQNRMTGKNFQL